MSLNVRRAVVVALAVTLGAWSLHTLDVAGEASAPGAQSRHAPRASLSQRDAAGPATVLSVREAPVGKGSAKRVALRVPPGVWAVRVSPDVRRAMRTSTADAGRYTHDLKGVRKVSLTVGTGRTHGVLTNSGTVLGALAALHVRLAAKDVVKPSRTAPLRSGGHIRVIRVTTGQETESVLLHYPVIYQDSSSLLPGQTQLSRAGANGKGIRIYSVTYWNGRPVFRDLIAQRVVTAPVPEVVLRGAAATASSGDSQTGQATWYACAGMHAAHLTLPFGTVVTVTDLDNGRQVVVVINDRGPTGAGKIIDLCSPAFAVLAPLSQGVANVRITW